MFLVDFSIGGGGVNKRILECIYQYVVKLRVFFNIPQTWVSYHMFNEWRPCGKWVTYGIGQWKEDGRFLLRSLPKHLSIIFWKSTMGFDLINFHSNDFIQLFSTKDYIKLPLEYPCVYPPSNENIHVLWYKVSQYLE